MYDYRLPQDLIAKTPASPRDFARLMVYKTETDEIYFDRFLNLNEYLPPHSFLVLNRTKVVPARLVVRKEATGGEVELLLLVNELSPRDKFIKALSDRKLVLGQNLLIDKNLRLTAAGQNGRIFLLKPNFPTARLNSILFKCGITPIPKYIKHTPLAEKQLRRKYQSVFAQKAGSVAAPTASLHFTKRVFDKLERQGIPHFFVVLHVGLGTFAPVTEENFKSKTLFEEYCEIDKGTARKINRLKKSGKKLIAVGTTTVRTLESAAIFSGAGVIPAPFKKNTDLFIMPRHKFAAIDGLVTNFHLPKSSLMLLVEAFLRHKKAKRGILDLYETAVREKFRFYSFGDVMLIV